MALPRKGLRRIVVGGVAYVWAIRKKPTRAQADYERGTVNVAIERADNPSMKLIVMSDIPHPKNALSAERAPVRPSDVRRWIEYGIRAGWNDDDNRVHTLNEKSA